MRKLFLIVVITGLISACGITKKNLGLEKTPPDASNANAKEMLVLPPNYNLHPVVAMKQAQK